MVADHEDTDLERFLDRLERRSFEPDVCFLCARDLNQTQVTVEHIIPRWAQRRYELWDQQMTLINGSVIPYRQLTVPCCIECNRIHLQPIEDAILAAVESGAAALRKLPAKVPFLWLGKILYGLLYREVLLPLNRRDPQAGPIVPEPVLRAYLSHLKLLQQARGQLETVDFKPGSIFVFNTQEPENPALRWDFVDEAEHLTIGVRMGKVGLIGSLADGGAQEIENFLPAEFFELPLHPLQFRELFASVAYRATTATRTPKHVTVEGVPHRVFQLPLMGWSLKPLFEEWDVATYAGYLAFYLGISYEEVFAPPESVLTYLINPDGSVRFLPVS